MIVSELLKLKLKAELISIERDCHDEELTGIVNDVDENTTSMHLYDDDGTYLGFTVFETDQITEVYWGNREHHAIAQQVSGDESITIPEYKSTEFQEIIIELNSQFPSISLHPAHGEDYYPIGKIESHDENWLKIHAFGTRKTLSPMTKLIARNSITRIVVNSPYQNQIVKLHTLEL